MSKKPQRDEEAEEMRVPRPKKGRLNLRVPTIPMPHLELIAVGSGSGPDEDGAGSGVSGLSSQTGYTGQSALTGQSAHTSEQPSDGVTSMSGETGLSGYTSRTSQPTPSSTTSRTRQAGQRRQTGQTAHTGQTTATAETDLVPISPVRDFTKMPNSVVREAIPSGLFRSGKSKQLYDVLYTMTRGAIKPTRTVRITKGKLMKAAGIGSRNTFDAIVSHLCSVGLLSLDIRIGEAEGNLFEVFTVDEIRGGLSGQTDQTSATGGTSADQILRTPVGAESALTRMSSGPIESEVSAEAKTLFKTLKTRDDERAVSHCLEKLNEAAKSVTGRELTSNDYACLERLLELVIDETALAALRTNSVSAYIPFATEHLRRRLSSRPRGSQATGRGSGAADPGRWGGGPAVGSSAGGSGVDVEVVEEELVPQPLGDKRDQGLELLRNMARNYGDGPESLENLRSLYTPEDWQWFMENLG